MSPCSSTWCPRHDCARTHAHTSTHCHSRTTVDEHNTFPGTHVLQPSRHAHLSCRNNTPSSFPLRFPLAFLGAHTTRAAVHPPSIPRASWQGCPFPPIMGNIEVRMFGRTNRSISSLNVTSRGPSFPLVFSFFSFSFADGSDRLSAAPLDKPPTHPQTSSRARPVTTPTVLDVEL